MISKLIGGKIAHCPYKLYKKPFGIYDFKTIAAGSYEGYHLAVVRIHKTHCCGLPVNG